MDINHELIEEIRAGFLAIDNRFDCLEEQAFSIKGQLDNLQRILHKQGQAISEIRKQLELISNE